MPNSCCSHIAAHRACACSALEDEMHAHACKSIIHVQRSNLLASCCNHSSNIYGQRQLLHQASV